MLNGRKELSRRVGSELISEKQRENLSVKRKHSRKEEQGSDKPH
jgi:hypothetical protein